MAHPPVPPPHPRTGPPRLPEQPSPLTAPPVQPARESGPASGPSPLPTSRSCRTRRYPRRSPKHRETRRGPGRYRRTPTACPAARASLYLYGWNPLRSTRFRVDKIPQRLDRPPAPPRGFRGDWLKSLTLSTSTASPGHGEVLEEVAALAGCCRSARSVANPVHQLRTHAGRWWRCFFLIHQTAGNHSSCPRRAFPRGSSALTCPCPGGSLQAPE